MKNRRSGQSRFGAIESALDEHIRQHRNTSQIRTLKKKKPKKRRRKSQNATKKHPKRRGPTQNPARHGSTRSIWGEKKRASEMTANSSLNGGRSPKQPTARWPTFGAQSARNVILTFGRPSGHAREEYALESTPGKVRPTRERGGKAEGSRQQKRKRRRQSHVVGGAREARLGSDKSRGRLRGVIRKGVWAEGPGRVARKKETSGKRVVKSKSRILRESPITPVPGRPPKSQKKPKTQTFNSNATTQLLKKKMRAQKNASRESPLETYMYQRVPSPESTRTEIREGLAPARPLRDIEQPGQRGRATG